MNSKTQKIKIKFGILGCSRIAVKRMMPAIVNSEYAKLVAVGSRDLNKAKEVALRFRVNNYGAYEDILINKEIQAIYISLPNSLHEEWAIKACEAGKHVICEKPAGISYAAAKRMVDAAKKNNIRLMEGLMFRYHPQQLKVKELIREGTLGELIKFDGCLGFTMPEENDIAMRKEFAGGALNSCMVYPISASRMIFDEEPISVFCKLAVDLQREVDTRASIFLEYSRKRIALASAFFGSYFQSTYSILGAKAHIRMIRAYAVPANMETKMFLDSDDKIKEINFPPVDHFQLMLAAFYKQVLNKENKTEDFENDLLAQARVLEAARISNAEKRLVNISEII